MLGTLQNPITAPARLHPAQNPGILCAAPAKSPGSVRGAKTAKCEVWVEKGGSKKIEKNRSVAHQQATIPPPMKVVGVGGKGVAEFASSRRSSP